MTDALFALTRFFSFFFKMTTQQTSMDEAATAEQRRLRIGTLNLNDRAYNARSFSEFILEKNLDIVCFNECGEQLTHRLNGIMKKNGYEHCFASAAFAGNALFSRLPILKASSKSLRASRGTETRSAAIAEIRVDVCPGVNVDLAIAAVHLDHVDEPQRIEQFHSLLSIVSVALSIFNSFNSCFSQIEKIEKPTIIMGDFNALFQRDYSKQEWQHINSIRAK